MSTTVYMTFRFTKRQPLSLKRPHPSFPLPPYPITVSINPPRATVMQARLYLAPTWWNHALTRHGSKTWPEYNWICQASHNKHIPFIRILPAYPILTSPNFKLSQITDKIESKSQRSF